MKVALERRVGEVVKVSVFRRDQRGIEDVVAKDSGIGNIAQCGHFHRGRSHVWRIEHVYGNEAIASINASSWCSTRRQVAWWPSIWGPPASMLPCAT